MTTAHCLEFISRSFAVAALACLAMAAVRHAPQRIRMLVTYAAWAGMALLAIDCVIPLPRLALSLPASGAIGDTLGRTTGHAILILWSAGALALIARELFCLIRLRTLIRSAELNTEPSWLSALKSGCDTLDLKCTVELRWNDQLGPCAAGWLLPVILLPRAAAAWPEEMRSHVIIHELAHFQRRDLWLQVLTRLIAAAHWFNPLSIVLRRWTEAEREQACDSLVVRHGGDALAYAKFLLAFASGYTLRASAPVAAP